MPWTAVMTGENRMNKEQWNKKTVPKSNTFYEAGQKQYDIYMEDTRRVTEKNIFLLK